MRSVSFRSGLFALALVVAGSPARAETLFVNDFTAIRGYDTGTRPAAADEIFGDDHLGYAGSITVGPDGNVYAFDLGNFDKADILRFQPDGTFVDVFSAGTGLSFPEQMTFGPGGDLYVVDSTAATPGVYRFDGTTGAAKGLYTTGVDLRSPFGLAFDGEGRLYVSDPWQTTSVIQRYDATGAFDKTVLQTKSLAPDDLINFPRGLCFGKDGALYIVDHFDSVVYRYDPSGPAIASYAAVSSDPQACAFGKDDVLYVDTFGPNGIVAISPPVGKDPPVVSAKFATDLPGHRTLAVSDASLVSTTTTTTSTTSTSEQPLGICGDADGNGSITASDALKVLRASVGNGLCPLELCDTNDDGNLAASDALRVLKKAVGLVVTLVCSTGGGAP